MGGERSGAREFTPKQQAFIEEYLKDPNATQAALRAGYSSRTAYRSGADNLRKPQIRAAIARHREERCERVKVDADWVLHELITLAKANFLDYVDLESGGKVKVDLSKLSRDQAAAVSEVTFDELAGGGTRVKFKLVDKLRTLDLLGKHTDVRAFLERHSVEDGDDLAAALEQIEERVREGRKSNGDGREPHPRQPTALLGEEEEVTPTEG
jgi:phage terminase small subunit